MHSVASSFLETTMTIDPLSCARSIQVICVIQMFNSNVDAHILYN